MARRDYLVKGTGTEVLLPRICFYTFERYRAQEKVERSRHFLGSTIDSLSAHIAIIDAQGQIVMVNKAWRIFAAENGGTENELCEGVNYFCACLERDSSGQPVAGELVDNIQQVIQGKKQYFEMEYPCHSPDKERWFNVRVTPLVGQGVENAVVRPRKYYR